MNNDTYHSNRLPISGSEGWQQMQLLLNKQLPVQKQFIRKKWLAYTIALLLCIGSMFISLPLNTPLLFSVEGVSKDVAPLSVTSQVNTLQEKNYHQKHTKALPFFNPLTGDTLQHTSPVATEKAWLPGREVLSETAEVITSLSKGKEDKNIFTLQQPANATDTADIAAATGTSTAAAFEKHRASNNPFNLLAGIGLNAVVGPHQNLQPYPVAVARYNLNKRWYVAAGVAAYSPVASAISGVSKTVYVNDTVNNVQLYKETTTYNPLYYADIPVTAGIRISKKLAVQAGVQVSVLLNKRTNKTTASYGFRGTAATITPQPAMVDRQTETPIPLRNIDYRFVTGLRYTINKTVVGLDYQQALEPAGKGSGNSSNKVIALSVVFKIK